MNTGYLRPAVATVPTVYGIETTEEENALVIECAELQQYLPFTVLKRYAKCLRCRSYSIVATVPTVYGIETRL